MWYNGSMIANWIKEWAIVISGGATFLLALGAFWAIRQTRNIQKAEKRERLLNEIIEWATNILRLNSDLFDFTESVRLEMSGISSRNIKKLYSDTVASKDKGKYIKITTRAACNNASDAVIRLQDELSKIANLLDGFIVRNEIVGDVSHLITTEDAMGKDRDERQDTVEKHRREIAPLCNLIIEEATKIKTRDMGNKEENMSKEGEPARSNEIILKDIEKLLTRIEGYVIQIRKNMKAQGVGGFGFTGMAAGMALVATGVQTTGGLVIFGVGLIVTLYSFYFM